MSTVPGAAHVRTRYGVLLVPVLLDGARDPGSLGTTTSGTVVVPVVTADTLGTLEPGAGHLEQLLGSVVPPGLLGDLDAEDAALALHLELVETLHDGADELRRNPRDVEQDHVDPALASADDNIMQRNRCCHV